MLTINDHEKVREWYEEFNIKEVEVNYSVSRAAEGRGKYRELIITNY
ncbi:DNA adenine methylase [Clostridium disporicum]|uniref:DNA adenine methylase n=1 Tax=Clostridium disporicum TaxID=84024 RepID=A0A174F0U9_9CLOT|nr:DNA adenine methylase [Clostridium disporicum]CUO42426.1 DNA adenine methylase [Clostridium disporicum]SCJ61781.1 Site-specific DNA methylase [uncultured Clostridium sp.]SCJ89660.1 Site-specific DNA methylase [uncultured Clostridium sp.]